MYGKLGIFELIGGLDITMYRNMHRVDQMVRIILGLGLVYFGFIDHSIINDRLYGAFLGVFGIMNLIAGVMGICPVYVMAGFSTCKGEKVNNSDEFAAK